MPRVGEYEVAGELGRGGVGRVLEARHLRTGRPVALKLLHAGPANEAARRRFAREVQLLLRLQHPHLVELLDAGEHQGAPFLVMERLEGETLARRLARGGPLAPRAAAGLGLTLARALAHAHARGVLHRDVKPENVLLRAPSGDPVLIDFGLGLALDPGGSLSRLTSEGALVGTPLYLAPELARGDLSGQGPPLDVYGLCATLYEALTGRPHRDPGAGLSDLLQELERPPPALSALRAGLDPALEAIVLRGLRLAPEERFPDAAALAAALEGWLAGQGAPPGARVGAGPVAAVVLLAGAALAGLVLARRGQPRAPSPPVLPPAAPATATTPAPAPPAPQPAPLPGSVPSAAPDEALEEADRAIAADPQDPATWSNRGILLLRRGEYARALPDAERAVALAPRDPDAHALRGHLLLRLERRDEAGESLEEALRLDPRHPWAGNELGRLRELQGRTDEALRLYSTALEGLVTQPTTYLNRARLLATSDPYAALRDLDRAIELDPAPPTLVERACLLLDTGQRERAEADLRSALAALGPAPGLPAGQRGLRALARALLGEHTAAEAEARELLAGQPLAIALEALSVSLLARGDREGAQAALREAVALMGERLEAARLHRRLRALER